VEPEDVDLLTAAEEKLEDFALPNALREMDGRKALNVLHRLLEDDDPLRILGGVINQMRVLLLAREVLDQGGGVNEVVQQLTRYPNLKIKPYPARLAAEGARRMDMADFEMIYRRLLEIDTAIKSSQIEGGLALDLLVADFTSHSY
jgi:DNA polymerase-3 subunit delta